MAERCGFCRGTNDNHETHCLKPAVPPTAPVATAQTARRSLSEKAAEEMTLFERDYNWGAFKPEELPSPPQPAGTAQAFRFSLEDLANFVCEFTQDGKNPRGRDVVDWFRWFERKCGLDKSFILSTAPPPTGTPEPLREAEQRLARAECQVNSGSGGSQERKP